MKLHDIAARALSEHQIEQALDVMTEILLEDEGDADVEDAKQPPTLQDHDEQFHGGHFDPSTMSCKLRKSMAGYDSPDAAVSAFNEKLSGVSGNKRRTYLALMAKKRPDLDAEDVLMKIADIGDRKIQGDAFRWLMKKAVRLPEDLSKVVEARSLSDRFKKDPLSFETPQACVNALKPKFTPKAAVIDPDTVPELSDRRDMGHGVVTYAVDDTVDGQTAMRKIIDSHWGEDANPWCLLARCDSDNVELTAHDIDRDEFWDWWESLPASEKNRIGETDIYEDGAEPEDIDADADAKERAEDYYNTHGLADSGSDDPRMRSAWHYWKHYSALPKRVAFKDGELLSFMATDSRRSPLPIPGYYLHDPKFLESTYKYADEYKRQHPNFDKDVFAWMLENHPEDLPEHYQKYVEERKQPVREEWWDRNDSPHDGIPVGLVPVPGSNSGQMGEGEIYNGKLDIEPVKTVGKVGEPGYSEWDADGTLRMRVFKVNAGKFKKGFEKYSPSGYLETFDDGRLSFTVGDDGETMLIRDPQTIAKDGMVSEELGAQFDDKGLLKGVELYDGAFVYDRDNELFKSDHGDYELHYDWNGNYVGGTGFNADDERVDIQEAMPSFSDKMLKDLELSRRVDDDIVHEAIGQARFGQEKYWKCVARAKSLCQNKKPMFPWAWSQYSPNMEKADFEKLIRFLGRS